MPPSSFCRMGFVIRHHLIKSLQTFGAHVGHRSVGPVDVEDVFRLVNGRSGVAATQSGWCSPDLKRTRWVGIGAAWADLDFFGLDDPGRTTFVHLDTSIVTEELDAIVLHWMSSIPGLTPGFICLFVLITQPVVDRS